MESKSNSSKSSSNKGAQRGIEYVITNPQESWATKVQRVDHSDHVEDEGEDLLIVNPKFQQRQEPRGSHQLLIQSSCCPTTSDREVWHLPVELQDLPTITKTGCYRYQLCGNPNRGEPVVEVHRKRLCDPSPHSVRRLGDDDGGSEPGRSVRCRTVGSYSTYCTPIFTVRTILSHTNILYILYILYIIRTVHVHTSPL
jgi:hypothetical protein